MEDGAEETLERFSSNTGFLPEDLKGQLVLDVGCGAGRFSKLVNDAGGTVVGFDISSSVDVAFEAIGRRPNVHLLQASVFQMPFAPSTFDSLFSIYVLQHTPDPHRAFLELPLLLKRGGRIAVGVYRWPPNYVLEKYRQWTSRLPPRLLYALCHLAVPIYYLHQIPMIRGITLYLFPIAMYPNWRRRVLETFDFYSSIYQSYHTYPEVFSWFQEAGLEELQLLGADLVALQGRRC
ncbi:class I SAM-dependent methyltransferase [Nitrospinae bacterium AH_259_B05_G02_I21]|nr:class I SAM-dependent methyltransferase [Nitrospinae bacterium AH_259_B05_G02_I21]